MLKSESLLHAWPKRLEQVSCRQKIAYLHNLQEVRSKEKTSFLRRKASLKETYVYTIDAVKAILMLLYKGEAGQAYNVANESSHTTIRKMAELVSKTLSQEKSKVVIDIPADSKKLGYAPDVKMKLNSDKIESLGWKPTVGLADAYRRMAEWMKEQKMI